LSGFVKLSGAGGAFALVFAVFAIWLGGPFLTADSRLLDIHSNIPVLILALAVMVTLIAGQFDLSVGSMATLVVFLCVGLPVEHHWPFALTILACLAVGAFGGLINGLLVSKVGINAFIATLGTGGVLLGMSTVFSDGQTIAPPPASEALPGWFSGGGSIGSFQQTPPSWLVWLGVIALAVRVFFVLSDRRPEGVSARIWRTALTIGILSAFGLLLLLGLSRWVDGTSWGIAILIGLGVITWTMYRYTSFGRYARATGSNAAAARLAGVQSNRITVLSFILGGVLAACAGIMLAAINGSAAPNVAVPFLLPAFAATFLSTVLFSLGRFTVWGTIVGGIFLVWIAQGLVLGGLPFTWTEVVNGLVLIGAVGLGAVYGRSRE
jgi:ribose/xylose/arabinose/galactoside ABC-type transport system permease subunit